MDHLARNGPLNSRTSAARSYGALWVRDNERLSVLPLAPAAAHRTLSAGVVVDVSSVQPNNFAQRYPSMTATNRRSG